jgi:hypothetical protein
MGLFPPGKGGGEDVERGYKGKGVLIHSYTEGNGYPLAITTTSAKGNEREQVPILLDSIHVYTGRRARKNVKRLACDKGYDPRALRKELRRRGIQPEIPKRIWKNKKRRTGRPLTKRVARYKVERSFAWLQRKFRCFVCRWERRRIYFNGFICLAVIVVWAQKIAKISGMCSNLLG